MRSIYVAVLSLLILSGCVSTSVKSYSDADFQRYKIAKVALDLGQLAPAVRDDVENSVSQRLKAMGVDVVPLSIIVPPTRDLTPDQIRESVSQAGYPAILTMQITDESEKVTYGGSINNTYVNAYASGNRVNAYGTGYSTPIVNARGVTVFRATLYDAKSGKKTWLADLNVKAQGTGYVGKTDKIAASAADALAAKLREDGRI